MLAYVFWHWPAPTVERSHYEMALASFHGLLRQHAPPGFDHSYAVAFQGEPWANRRGAAYADWYLVSGSAVLDPLNEVAISPPLAAAHGEIARLAAAGAGGLYRLRSGTPGPWMIATWLSKPAGMPYPDFYRALEPYTGAEGGLWRRQMVLGPAPEFCWQSESRASFPSEFSPLAVSRRLVPGG